MDIIENKILLVLREIHSSFGYIQIDFQVYVSVFSFLKYKTVINKDRENNILV